MKKIGVLFILFMLLLLGCDVAEKMVIQYEDYQETVLSERFVSEMGFSMQVIQGIEVREDVKEKRVELLEPYPLSIRLRDDVENVSHFYDELSGQSRILISSRFLGIENVGIYDLDYLRSQSFPIISSIENVGKFDPSSISLPYFDMVLLFEFLNEAHIYVYKEVEEGLFYSFEIILPFEEVTLHFPKYRAMLATFTIPGLEEKENEEDNYSSLPPYRGEFEHIPIHHMKYEE